MFVCVEIIFIYALLEIVIMYDLYVQKFYEKCLYVKVTCELFICYMISVCKHMRKMHVFFCLA